MQTSEVKEPLSKGLDGVKRNLGALAEQFKPEILSAYLDYKKKVDGGEDELRAKRELKVRVGMNLFKSLAAGSMYEVTALTWGVGAWNLNGTHSATDATYQDASKLAIYIGTFVADGMPLHWQEGVANALVATEIVVAAARIGIEQKVLWERFRVVADPAGTFLSPLTAGIPEELYKIFLLQYSPDPKVRLAVALTALWGEFARLTNDAIIYYVLARYQASRA